MKNDVGTAIDKYNWVLLSNTDVNIEGTYAYENTTSRNWRFRHKYNPTTIRVVIEKFSDDGKSTITGDKELVRYLDKIGELSKLRLYNKQYKKDKYEMVERVQSFKKIKEDKF